MAQKRYPMPVEPFVEIVDRALTELSVEGLQPDDTTAYQSLGLMTPLSRITWDVARAKNCTFFTASKMLNRLRSGELSDISLNDADAIVCALSHPGFWYTDEQVKHLYAAIQ